jgi:hypothetical protein
MQINISVADIINAKVIILFQCEESVIIFSSQESVCKVPCKGYPKKTQTKMQLKAPRKKIMLSELCERFCAFCGKTLALQPLEDG